MTRSALRWKNRTSPTRVESTSTVAISNWRARKVYLDDTRVGSVLNVLVKSQFGRYGMKVRIDSFAGDGSKSWVVISRGF